MWWNGPDFLNQIDNSMWPSQKIDDQDTNLESANLELKKSAEVNMHKLIDINRYSLLKRMLVVTSYMLRFIHNKKRCMIERNNYVRRNK